VIPVFGSQRPYVDLNFALGSFGVNGGSVSSLALLSGFTFTRASLAMGYDATGKLTYGPNNLLLQSQTFGTGWAQVSATVTSDAATAPDGTLTADKLVEAAATAQHFINQSTSVQVGVPFVTSVYAKAGERNWLRIQHVSGPSVWFNLAAGTLGTVTAPATAGMVSVGNGWYRCYVAGVSSGVTTYFFTQTANNETSYTGDGTSGLFLWGAQLEAVTYQTTPSTYYPTTTAAYYGPRLVYDPVTLASQGILVEEARTNICIYSQQFDNAAWTLTGATISANAATSPDGTANADRLVEDSGTSQHRAFQSPTTTAVATTASCYVKAGGRSWVFLRLNDSGGTNRYVWFNVTTGVVGTVDAGWTGSITAVGGGWYRCVGVMATAFAGVNTFIVGASNADGVASYTGNGAAALDIWQAQIEAGVGASSPIPTTTAAVTRAAEDVTLTGLSIPYPLSIVTSFTRAFDSGGIAIIAQVDDGVSSANNRSTIQVEAADLANLFVRMSFSVQADITVAGALVAGTTYGVAGRVGSNDAQMAKSGTLGTADTSVSSLVTAVVLRIGSRGAEYANGTISRIRIFNRGLPDPSLQSLTS
jgi:hypothetical protein